MIKKLVDGQLVDMTPEEDAARNIPITPSELSCDAYQIRSALISKGWLLDVENAIAQANDPILTAMWCYKQVFRSNNDNVIAVMQLIGKTAEEKDELFKLAVTL